MDTVGIGGFLLSALVREQTTKVATIPQIPLEDGSFANDHIILSPVSINIEGRVSDILLKPDPALIDIRRNLAEIGNITVYLPSRTQTQINRITNLQFTTARYITKIKSAIAAGRQAWEFFGNKDSATSNDVRSQFVEMLDYYYDNKTLMRIETQRKTYENMFITSRVITTDNTADDFVDFQITAQQLRFAEVIFSEIQKHFPKPASGSASDQVSGSKSKGRNDAPITTPEKKTSLLGNILRGFGS